MRRFLSGSATALLLLTGVPGCVSVQQTADYEWPIEQGSRLSVSSFNGDITITEGDVDGVVVHAIMTSWLGSGEFGKIEVAWTPGPVTSILEARRKAERVEAGVAMEIMVPRGTAIAGVETSNGEIVINSSRGDAVLNTSNGQIVLVGFDGPVTASSSNGDIVLSDVTGSALMETSNGDIAVVRGEVEVRGAETSNGSITIRAASFPEQGAVLDTSNGSILLQLGPGCAATLVLSTSNGTISVEGPFVSQALTDDEGTVTAGGGGPRVVVDTSNGGIALIQE
jgi:DUF4097 and DUF4098 domain-containing protein YvlB